MKNGLSLLVVFIFSLAISITFQNCGNSSLKANSSGDTIKVPIPGDNSGSDNDGDGNGGGNNGRVFNLENGDNILYVTGGGSNPDLASSRLIYKQFGSEAADTYLDSIIYEQAGVSHESDLPSSYCSDSALPHCRHINNFTCQGIGCFEPDQLIRCHWQNSMSNSDINNLFSAINSLKYGNKVDETYIDGCNNPKLSFNTSKDKLEISLAAKECVPDGDLYAVNGTNEAVKDVFNNELNGLRTLMDAEEQTDFCNNYSTYYWNTTKFTYNSVSGYTPAENAYSYSMSYEGQFVSMKFKEPGENEVCAEAVPIQPSQMDIIFPPGGLKYDVFRAAVAVADAPHSHIIFEDPIDGGAHWKFYMNQISAMTFNGGPYLEQTQSDAIKNLLENTLVELVKSNPDAFVVPCE